MDMSTFCTKENKRCVYYTSVCSIISIDLFMLTASELLLSGKQMQIAVRVYPFFPNFYSLVTFMETIFKTHYKDLGTNTSSQTKFFMKKILNSL